MSMIALPVDTISTIVGCIEDAFGDELYEDIRRNNLNMTTNSYSSRGWDFLSRNLAQRMGATNCLVVRAKRRWQMAVVYDKKSKNIITFMKEARYAELHRTQRSRSFLHYIDACAMSFNSDLIPGQQQLFIYPHEFVNEKDLPFLTSSLLQNLYAENEVDVIRNHVLVLFTTYGFRLERIRAVMITPTLDIAQNCDQDWSQYISSNVSTIVDQVAASASRGNNPTGKLSLKPKALKRKKQPNIEPKREAKEIEETS